MSNILSYEFEELPLVIVNGIEAALINGLAEIRYSRDGQWQVESISIEGYQPLTAEQRAAGERPWVYVKAPAEIEHMICERLHSKGWYEKLDDAIAEQLASDREDAAEQRAEMRRDFLMGL